MGNAFSAGIFLAVAVMDLLPDSIEKIEEAGCFSDLTFVLIIVGYVIILILEKIMFTSHLSFNKSHRNSAILNEIRPCTNEVRPCTNALSDRFKVKDQREAISNTENLTVYLVENELHEPDKQPQRRKSDITSYLLVTAFSVHSIFEGIAIGLQTKTTTLINLGLGVGIHKLPASLAMSLALVEQPRKKAIGILSIFCMASPVGISVGIALTGMSAIVQAVFLCLSCGTFLYISASELIVEEFSKPDYKLHKFVSFLIGLSLFTGVKIFIDMTFGDA